MVFLWYVSYSSDKFEDDLDYYRLYFYRVSIKQYYHVYLYNTCSRYITSDDIDGILIWHIL